MLHPARVLTFLVVLALGLVLRHYVGEVGRDEPAEPDVAPSVVAAHNTPVANELSRRWALMPQVVEAHAGYSGGDDFGVVVASAVCLHCNRQNLMSRLARDIWVSDLQHLTSFKVSIALEGQRKRPLTHTWNVRRDAPALYDRFGNGLVDPDTVSN